MPSLRRSTVETEAPAGLSSMTASASAFPTVNLMPPALAEEARVRRAKIVAGGAAGSAVVLLGLLYVAAAGSVSSAQSDLDAANAQAAQLKAQVAQYADVPRVYAEVTTAQQQLVSAMGAEVRWSTLLNNLALTTPKGVALKSLTGTVIPTVQSTTGTPAGGAGAAGTQAPTSVLGKPGIGTVTFQGEASGYPAVAAWLDSLAKQSGYVDPYVSNAKAPDQPTDSAGVVQPYEFTNSVTITSKALSHRYDKAGS